ncbi:putative pyridine nucleotide-disulfide oxidoreductase RclA [Tolypocladium ophioglossoides CBS 100239]|uniref:Putative pyridine nucleotide-disulfide oxidoreductase RclA n=1 Tax=Tolypocladium ophioglossoides (strain CBS 100239) TaxID=1163406 RepID=A0A0L0N4Q7_TOLOC|nr:putative pyridine nucleotide-disulfide oxidoreductase RclA [Tolypocladium ophioglossoides CBS 100239]
MSTHYNAVVIGSGQGGTPLSMAFAQAKHKTALIESAHVGGCCINEGCTPTKTMIASGRVAYLARRGPDYGVRVSSGSDHVGATNDVHVAMDKVRQRKRDIVDSFRSGSERRVREAGVELITGSARFQDERTVRVRGKDGAETTLTADRIFICSGERPAPPKIDGFEAASFPSGTILNSTSIQELGVVPSHLVVVGGGYVGLEFGQLFRRLGSAVTILQCGAQLLPREDADVSEAILSILREDGVKVLLKASPSHVRATGDADPATAVAVSVSGSGSGGDGPSELLASHVLFAAGRVPNTDSLNPGAAGIKTTARGHVAVDPQLRTSNPRVWALGDVKGGPAFTHVSYDDFRLLRANLIKQDANAAPLTTVGRILPYVVYTDPQLGHVGLHEHEARTEFPGRKIQVASMPMAYVARALETDESRGLMKAVVDADSQQILGFTCLGLEGGEVMSVVQMAMVGRVKWTALRDAVWAHPSLAQSLNNLWGFLK